MCHKLHDEIFENRPEIKGIHSHGDFIETITWFNNIENEKNIQIGSRLYLLGEDQLIMLTGKLKTENILTKTR